MMVLLLQLRLWLLLLKRRKKQTSYSSSSAAACSSSFNALANITTAAAIGIILISIEVKKSYDEEGNNCLEKISQLEDKFQLLTNELPQRVVAVLTKEFVIKGITPAPVSIENI